MPGIFSQANSIVPFSNQLAGLYSSPFLGSAWYPLALTLFWIWFINVNLAFFNAIPLYPLDGGQALLNFFSHFGRKGIESRAKLLTTVVSLAMFVLILSFLFLPRILGAISV
ncbi:MAG: site-2 protease family protein [Nitrososphaerales archaeon]